jgi:hypothetical protein
MTTDRDPRTRIVLSWLREETHENAERVLLRALNEVDTTPQRRAWWPAWRTDRMNAFAKLIAAAAAVLVVVAVVGYQFLPGGSGPGGMTASPSPSPTLIARGDFVTDVTDGTAVELEAIARGSSVTGRMTVSAEGAAFTVDLQCARTTGPVSIAGEQAKEGLIMIGGVTTDSTIPALSPEGTFAAIVLKRGSPVEANIWSQRGGPTSKAASCLAYLEEQVMLEPGRNTDRDWLSPIEGTIEFGP